MRWSYPLSAFDAVEIACAVSDMCTDEMPPRVAVGALNPVLILVTRHTRRIRTRITPGSRDKLGKHVFPVVGCLGLAHHAHSDVLGQGLSILKNNFQKLTQGRGILPLQTGLIRYVVISLVATEYGVNDTWSNCPNLHRHGVGWDSVKCMRFTGSCPVKFFENVCVRVREWTGARRSTRRKLYSNASLLLYV